MTPIKTTKDFSFRRVDPRGVLKRLIAENPKAGRRKLLALFIEHFDGDSEFALEHIWKYWFEANYDKYAKGL